MLNRSDNPRITQSITPQALAVLKHLEAAGSITNVEAHAVLKVRSVSRRITELQDADIMVTKEFKRDTTGQRYVRYVLDADDKVLQKAAA